jgi:DNA-binding response OmpR family regulator
MSGDEARAREAGCDDYIPKPIDLKELEKKINKHFPGEKLKLSV